MIEEIFDVVNERDKVIKQQPQSEVHHLNLMHHTTHTLIFNKHNQIFLQKRSITKDRQPNL